MPKLADDATAFGQGQAAAGPAAPVLLPVVRGVARRTRSGNSGSHLAPARRKDHAKSTPTNQSSVAMAMTIISSSSDLRPTENAIQWPKALARNLPAGLAG